MREGERERERDDSYFVREKDKALKKTSSERDNYKREVDGLQKDSETFQKRISELENLISTQM